MSRADVSVEIRDSAFLDIVGPAVGFEAIATGFLFTEGPLWDARNRRLLFSDIPGDVISAWSGGRTQDFRRPSHKSNGLTLDRQGRVLCCEHATSRVTRLEADGTVTVLASAFEGKELNSPNDIVVKTDGAIYFSDPTYGRMEYYGVPREPQLGFQGVYRVDSDGRNLTLLADDFSQPNGLCFSADERLLFVNDTERMHIRVFDVLPDGRLANSRTWGETRGEGGGAPDGMKIDSAENLWCCGPGGLHVFDRNARCLGVVRTPEVPANFTFGDDDLKSIYATCQGAVYRFRVKVPGRHIGS
jgi:gluconolactonase